MVTYWVPDHSLNSRIDAEFYRPDFVANERRIRAAGVCLPLDELRMPERPITNGIRGPELADTNYRMLRLQDVDGLWIDSSRSLRVSHAQFQANRRAWCTPGDILLAIGGYIGVVGKVADDAPQTMGQHAARLSFDTKKVDPDFMLAFLSSPSGTMLCQRYVSGGVQVGINLEDVREIRVLVPSQKVQHAIGNKLRKAERLRESASNVQRYRNVEIKQVYGEIQWREQSSFGWVPSRKFENGRVDAWFHQPAYIALADALKDRKDLIAVGQIARIVTDAASLQSFSPGYFDYYEIADVDSDSGMIISDRVAVSDAPSRAKFLVRSGDILVSTVRPNRKGIAIVPDGVARAVCSSGFAVLRIDDIAIAYYLRACLLNDIATHQLMRWNTGATYPAIDRWVPLEVRIPDVGTERMKEIGSALHESAKALALASELIQSTKADVEALIDGALDEAALLAEGEEIERWLKENPSHTPKKGAINGPYH